MLISPHEQERLLIHVTQAWLGSGAPEGLRLNYPEAVAIITSFLVKGARDRLSVAELMQSGRTVLGRSGRTTTLAGQPGPGVRPVRRLDGQIGSVEPGKIADLVL